MKVVEYIVIESKSSDVLKRQVNNKINEGYQPYGSMSVDNGKIYQPMVKYKNEI
ncbi:MAG: hypothetical protein ACOCP4_07600 [Candidatus Woesearchaeota archaeon]